MINGRQGLETVLGGLRLGTTAAVSGRETRLEGLEGVHPTGNKDVRCFITNCNDAFKMDIVKSKTGLKVLETYEQYFCGSWR
jgi:hypothetical protein